MTATELRPDHDTGVYHAEAWPGKNTDQHANEAAIAPSTHESKTQTKYGQKGETKTQQRQQPGKKQISVSEVQKQPEDQTQHDQQNQQKLKPRALLRKIKTVTVAGADTHLLFLTNKQATSLSKKMDSKDIDNVLKAFDIDTNNVELVINLLPDQGMPLMTHRTQSGQLREGATHTGT